MVSSGYQNKVQVDQAQSFSPVGTGLLQRKFALCNTHGLAGERSERDEEELTLQRSPVDQAETSAVPPIVHEVLRSLGQPPDVATRAHMEPRFGHDFSGVQVHTGVPKTIQTKLIIGQPNDRYEQEADRVADAVMRMPEPGVQRQVEPEEEEEETLQSKLLNSQIKPLVQVQRQEGPEEEEEELQAKPTSSHISNVNPGLESQIQSLKGGGQPLPESARAYFEPRFGCDFSQVRVHADMLSAEAVRVVNT